MPNDSDITIGLKTFLRPDKLNRCLNHIVQLPYEPDKVIVSDDSPRKDLNEEVYSQFRNRLPLQVLDMETNAGLGAGRNRILEKTDTDYLLIIDDDHYLSSDIFRLKRALESNPSLGGIGVSWIENGKRKIIAGDIRIKRGWMIIDTFDAKRLNHGGGLDYYLYDFIQNSAMFRTEALRDYRWDEEYVSSGEHEDFFLGHKTQTNWKFAVTPDIWIEHDPGPGCIPEYYSNHREKEKRRNRRHFSEKWGLKGYVFRGYHYKEPQNVMSNLGARVLSVLPPRFQWELKKRGYLDSIKLKLEGRDLGTQNIFNL